LATLPKTALSADLEQDPNGLKKEKGKVQMKKYIVAVVAMALFMAALVTISPLSGAQTVTIQNQKTGLRKPSPSPTPTPSSKTATWTGNGAYYDGGDFTLTDSRCEESNGEPYLYWVLTAGGKDSINGAAITINGAGPYTMTRQRNGSFKYTQTFDSNDPTLNSATSFVVPTNVTATYTRAKSANLVISHGCTGEVPVVPSFTLSFDATDVELANATYNPCPQVPFPFSGYAGETIEVCNFGGDLNLILEVPVDYTVTSSPEASCTNPPGGDGLTGGKLEGTANGGAWPGGNLEGTADGTQLVTWYCAVTSPDTVITITAPPSGSPSFSLAGVLFGEATYDFDSTACTGISTDYLSLDGDLHEVCDTDPTPNVQIYIPDEYTISSLPEANCQAGTPETGYILWSCTVTQANTVITITELPSFLLSVGGRYWWNYLIHSI